MESLFRIMIQRYAKELNNRQGMGLKCPSKHEKVAIAIIFLQKRASDSYIFLLLNSNNIDHIFLLSQSGATRERGRVFFRGRWEMEMLKQRVVIETRWITNAAISAILQFCNFCNLH